jgi:uncharacterized protein YkwD
MRIADILHTAGRGGRRHLGQRSRCATVVALGAVALTATAPAEAREEPCPGATEEPVAERQARAVAATVCLVNRERERLGLPELREQEQLAAAAEEHARDMVRRRYFAHVSPSGETMIDRLREAGFIRSGDGWAVGEALAWGGGRRARPASVVAAWLDSPPHRQVLLDRRYRRLGLGLAAGIPRVAAPAGGATYALDVGVRW